jgi:hypothetical protein
MSDNLLKISPELCFPKETVFEVPDEFNGPQRGTFYFRTTGGTLHGPFHNEAQANFHLHRLDDDGA